jgi:hypothetical protein
MCTVPFLPDVDEHTPLHQLDARLGTLPRQQLQYVPWAAAYPYQPEVFFTIAHTPVAVLLKYFVKEKYIRAVHTGINAPVYTDSCVEFFISIDEEPAYYNFEFNCIGAHLSGYGENKSDRRLLPASITRHIKYKAALSNEQLNDTIAWELTVCIPFPVFCHHSITTFRGKQCAANFYKCGDELPEPHFISWSNIQWPEPNFHLRNYFGKLLFA